MDLSPSPSSEQLATGPEIRLEPVSNGRLRYFATCVGRDTEAELSVQIVPPGLLVAERTSVPPDWKGIGITYALVDRLVADARLSRLSVAPVCPVAWGEAVQHIEWADVIRAWSSLDQD